MKSAVFLFALVSPLVAQHEHCDHEHLPATPAHPAAHSPHHPELKLPTHDDAWFHFHPFLSAAVAFGGSTSDKNLGLIQGAHAPIDDGFNLQGLEVGGLLELGPYFSVLGVYNTFWDTYDGWDGELEELYGTVSLPAGFSLRAGQFFAPFGHENQIHLHDRDFVEPPISLIRLLGEEGLIVQGGDLGIHLPASDEKSIFRFGYGQTRSHTHGGTRNARRDLYFEAREHAGEMHDDHHEDDHHEDDHHDQDHHDQDHHDQDHHDQDHHDEDHHDEDDHHEDHDHEGHAHGFAGNGGAYDVDKAYLDDGFFFARLESDRWRDHGLDQAGISLAAGRNGFGRTTWVLGADLYGQFTLADRPAWWRTELYYRSVDAYDRAGNPGHFDETGAYASVGCEFAEHWIAAGRLEWASGNRMAGAERRWRASANVTHVTHFADNADLHSRLQYSFDDLGGYGTEHSVWLQLVFNFGAGCTGHAH